MAFKTFVAGDVLTASEVNDYLMKQAVIVCTSSTRPTPVEGMTIYETDTNYRLVYNGSSWRYVTPITGSFTLTFTSSATTANASVTFPVTFSVAPTVSLSVVAVTGNTPVAINFTGAPSTTGFTAMARTVDGATYTGNITGYYIAIEAV